jgi:carboxylesterase
MVMTVAATALGLLVLAATIAAWGGWQRTRVEQRVAARLPIGDTGIIPGAEALELLSPGASMGVVLLHGFGDTPQTVEALAHALHAHGFDVAAPLLPGHGRTLRAFAASTRAEWLTAARAAHAEMRARHARVALVGLSLGGALAATVAEDDAELAALVLLAPYLDAPSWLRHLARAAPAIGVLLPYVGGDTVRSIHDPEARAKALAYGATTPRLVRELILTADGARAALGRVTAPTLYIQSREDNRVAEEVATRAFAALGARRKRLELMTGCGHVLTVDYCRERVTSMVLEWLCEATTGNEEGTA